MRPNALVNAVVRQAVADDIATIREICNEALEDGYAALDADPRNISDFVRWWVGHEQPYGVLVAELDGVVVGFAALDHSMQPYSEGLIADVSVFVSRLQRGHGIDEQLLAAIARAARQCYFRKIVLHAANDNILGQALCNKLGFRKVDAFRTHTVSRGGDVKIIAMEKVLS